MLLSIIHARKIFHLIHQLEYRRNWVILRYLMIFFFIGYLVVAFVVYAGYPNILSLLTGIVFFFGALFVFIVVRFGLMTITELIQKTNESELQNEKLEKSRQELKLINDELHAHNQELTKFNHIAAHDLQAPLHNISSIITLLERDHLDEFGPGAREYLSFITRSSERMRNLIIALLDYSKIGSEKQFQDVNSHQVMNEVVEDHDTIIKDHNVTVKFEHLPKIRAHRIELTQLFQNLLTNGIKFTRKSAHPIIEVTASEDDDNWHFVFSDNGIGIKDDDKDRIFNMFQRVHTMHEYEGSGIGLANCKKIVELHGGKIWVESKPNKGSQFHFTISRH